MESIADIHASCLIYIARSQIDIFGHPVSLYAFMLVIAMLLAIVIGCLYARARREDTSFILRINAIVYAAAAVIIILTNEYYVDSPLIPLAYLGATILVLAVYVLLARLFRKDTRYLLAQGVLALTAFVMCTRVGCLFAGCCFGPPTSGSFAIVYGPGTFNCSPGTPFFALRVVDIAAYIVLIVVAFFVLKKHADIRISLGFGALQAAVYYAGMGFGDPRCNHLLFPSCNVALVLSCLLVIIAIVLFVTRASTARTRKERSS